ncbi:MAG: beta-lactamase family protein [Armatimonadetes bacterium]|nr:beta-lactamase family protein [Armatimonadota bacterium]
MPSPPWDIWWRSVTDGLDAGAAPGGAVWLAVDGKVELHEAHGHARVEPMAQPLDLGMWFDLASVTKAVATTTCVVALVEGGRLELDRPAAAHLPELASAGKAAVTPRHLLTHTAGLPPFDQYYRHCADRASVRAAVLATQRTGDVAGGPVYSDVGFLTLGFLTEAVTGQRQDAFLRDRILTPAGLADRLGYLPTDHERCVATERCAWRGRVMQGEVHDENAWRCDGVAGHAGLFGTVEGVGRFAQAVLERRILSADTWSEVFRPREDAAAQSFWLGWKRLGYDADDPAAFGHDGFTGTLVWVSPQRRMVLALLTNRVHPTRENRILYEHRPAWVHQAAMLVDRG